MVMKRKVDKEIPRPPSIKLRDYFAALAEVQFAPPAVMPKTAKPAAARRTKIEIRNGFEQKAFGSGSE